MSRKIAGMEYYDICASGPHVFFVRAVEYVVSRLISAPEKAHVGFWSFLTNSLDELPVFAMEAGAGEVPFVQEALPLGGVQFLDNKVLGQRMTVRPHTRDGVFRFDGMTKHPVYAGTICQIHYEWEKLVSSSLSFIAAHDGDEAMEFLNNYYFYRRARNHARQCLLGLNGDVMPEFQRMGWEDVILPNGMAAGIRREVDSFFKAAKGYEAARLPWRRGILLAGDPGNGKTTICRALASSDAPVPVIYHDGAPTDQNMVQALERLHATMASNVPCIVLLEVDPFMAEEAAHNKLLGLLDGMFSCDGALVVVTTSWPEKLDLKYLCRPGRMDSCYLIPNPGDKERREILRRKLGKKFKLLSEEDVKDVLEQTSGLGFAHVQGLAARVLLAPVKDKKSLLRELKEGLEKARQQVRYAKNGKGSPEGSAGFKHF